MKNNSVIEALSQGNTLDRVEIWNDTIVTSMGEVLDQKVASLSNVVQSLSDQIQQLTRHVADSKQDRSLIHSIAGRVEALG